MIILNFISKQKYDKYFIVDIKGKEQKVSIQDLKPCYTLNLDQSLPLINRDEPIIESTNRIMQQRKQAQTQLRIQSELIQEKIDQLRSSNNRKPIEIQKIKDWVKQNTSQTSNSNQKPNDQQVQPKTNQINNQKLNESNKSKQKIDIAKPVPPSIKGYRLTGQNEKNWIFSKIDASPILYPNGLIKHVPKSS